MAEVLVIEDDAGVGLVVRRLLEQAGHRVTLHRTLAEGEAALDNTSADVVVLDVNLPDGDALDRLGRLPERVAAPVIVISANSTLATAVRATKAGAFEYLSKPFDGDELCAAVASAAQERGAAGMASAPTGVGGLIGRSPAMQQLFRSLARVSQTDLTVLITGESGTGKELVARALHDLGPRAAKPFIALNTAAIPAELIESELFGHERGAFTGAVSRSAGKIAAADGGTLFLDEIGDMPVAAQTRLLRFLENAEVTAVGATRTIRVDVRVVAATHQDLGARIADGSFREDLFHRLNVVPVAVPRLAQRGDDVTLLAEHFLGEAVRDGLPAKTLDDSARRYLSLREWPGNVRELENMMRRACVIVRDRQLTAANLSALAGGEADDAPGWEQAVAMLAASEGLEGGDLYDRFIGAAEQALFAHVLAHTGGNKIRAAELLGINRNTLHKKLSQ